MSSAFRASGARVCLVAMFLSLLPPPGHAVTLTWIDPLGGAANTSSNWSPAQIPTRLDVAIFDTTGTYTVTWNAAVDSTLSQDYRSGDVSVVVVNSIHDIASSLKVGDGTNDVVTVRLSDGRLRAGRNTQIGTGLNSIGTLIVSGATGDLLQNESVGVSYALMAVGGTAGTGKLSVLDGGKVVLSDRLNLALHSNGNGTVRVRGEAASGNQRRSQLIADGPIADCTMGSNGAHGVFEVLDGGLARFTRYLMAGEEAGDSAEVVIGGGGANDSARFVVGDLFASANKTTFGGGGWSRITLKHRGVMEVADTTEIGDVDGSDGLLTLEPGSRFITRSFLLREGTGQALGLRGGLLQVNGGRFQTSNDRLNLPGDAGAPQIELLNGATARFIGTSSVAPMTLGVLDDLTLHVTGNSSVLNEGGAPVVAENVNATVALTVSEGGSFSADRRLIAGKGGRAEVRVSTGGRLTSQGVDVAADPTSVSTMMISQLGQVDCNGLLNVGGTGTAQGGSGQVSIADGGVLSISNSVHNGVVWPTGTLNVHSGGRLDLSGVLTVRGAAAVFGGVVQGGSIALRGNGLLYGSGDVNALLDAAVDTTARIVVEGVLRVGDPAASNGFVSRGKLEIGPNDFSVLDLDSSPIGTVTMTGGHLRLPPGGGVLESGRRLSGNGTVHGDLLNSGTIIGDGSELAFDGWLRGIGEGVSGSELRFLSGGGFEGAGNLDGRVVIDTGAVIRATGDLTIGRVVPARLTDAMDLRGRIETGPHVVTIADASTPIVRGEIEMGGGVLQAIGSLPFLGMPGSRLSGRGRVVQSVLSLSAISPGPEAGRLRFDGSLVLPSVSTYVADLGNHSSAEHDTISVGGLTQIQEGAVLELHRLPSFSASPGDSFRVVEHGSSIGTFTTVSLDGLPIAGIAEVHYNSDGIWVVMLPGILGVGDEPRPGADVAALRFSSFGSPGKRLGVDLALPEARRVSVQVFDLGGRRVADLAEGTLSAGRHRFELPRDLDGTGVFFARAVLGEGASREVRTVRLVRLD